MFADRERSGTSWVGPDGYFSMMAAADRGEFGLVLEVRLKDEDRAHLTNAEPVAIEVPPKPRIIGLGLINATAALEAFGRLSNIDYFRVGAGNCRFPGHSIRVRRVLTRRTG